MPLRTLVIPQKSLSSTRPIYIHSYSMMLYHCSSLRCLVAPETSLRQEVKHSGRQISNITTIIQQDNFVDLLDKGIFDLNHSTQFTFENPVSLLKRLLETT